MPESSPDIMTVLLNAGPLGAIIAAMGLYIWRLHKQLKESWEARVRDAQNVADRVVNINNESRTAINGLTNGVEKLHALIDVIRNGRR